MQFQPFKNSAQPTRVQPIKFVSRRWSNHSARFVMAVNAAELFASKVAMTSSAMDIGCEMGKYDPEMNDSELMVRVEFQPQSGTPQKPSNEKVVDFFYNPSHTHFNHDFFFEVNEAAILLIKTTPSHIPFVALRLGDPGHISVALWDRKENRVELFDSSFVSADKHNHKRAYVEFLFQMANVRCPKIRFVNNIDLQRIHHQNDDFCQTYIYYYIHCRAFQKECPTTIVDRLKSQRFEERFQLIKSFGEYLMSY